MHDQSECPFPHNIFYALFYQILSACTDQLDRFKKYLNVI